MRNLELFPDPPRAAVYVLQRRDRQRFKIGWSPAPMKRIRRLPEFGAGQLDLAASTALWLPSRQRAEQVEDAVHKCLAPYAAEVGALRSGSDWYLPVAHPIALHVRGQMPLDEGADRRAALTPLQSGAARLDEVWVDAVSTGHLVGARGPVVAPGDALPGAGRARRRHPSRRHRGVQAGGGGAGRGFAERRDGRGHIPLACGGALRRFRAVDRVPRGRPGVHVGQFAADRVLAARAGPGLAGQGLFAAAGAIDGHVRGVDASAGERA